MFVLKRKLLEAASHCNKKLSRELKYDQMHFYWIFWCSNRSCIKF
jgi:hypothetical protein